MDLSKNKFGLILLDHITYGPLHPLTRKWLLCLESLCTPRNITLILKLYWANQISKLIFNLNVLCSGFLKIDFMRAIFYSNRNYIMICHCFTFLHNILLLMHRLLTWAWVFESQICICWLNMYVPPCFTVIYSFNTNPKS